MPALTRPGAFTPLTAATVDSYADEIERVVGAVFGDLTNTARPLVAVRRTSVLSVSNATDSVISWQTFDVDNDGMWDGGTPDRITIRTAGLWLIVSQLRFPAVNTTGIRAGKIMKNGTSVATNSIASGSQAGVAVGEGNTVQITARPQSFVVGDQIYQNVFQSSGSSMNLAIDYGSCWLSAVYLGL